MITQQQFTDSCLKEVKVFKHLYAKIVPGTLDFKPSGSQRTLNELLQYVMHAFIMELRGIETGKIENLKEAVAEAQKADTALFPSRMDELAELIKSVMTGMTDEKLAEEVDIFGRGAQARTSWLFELILKNMVGYKMQLFLYIKESGNSSIGTPDLWRGEDSKPAA
jgi:hypothetical protein